MHTIYHLVFWNNFSLHVYVAFILRWFKIQSYPDSETLSVDEKIQVYRIEVKRHIKLFFNFISAASSESLVFRRRMLVHQYCILLILVQKKCSVVVVSVDYYKFTTCVGSIKIICKKLKTFLVNIVCIFHFMISSFIYTCCQEDAKYREVLSGLV